MHIMKIMKVVAALLVTWAGTTGAFKGNNRGVGSHSWGLKVVSEMADLSG